MTAIRTIITIDEEKCDGCGACIIACAEGALVLENGKARLVGDRYCDGLGACLGECPRGAIRSIEREAEAFDESALSTAKEERVAALPCGCPSAQVVDFSAPEPCSGTCAPMGEQGMPAPSELSHWPVKLRLVPSEAPFLAGSSLLVAADCTPLACGSFHREYLKGRSVLMCCPKFDDRESSIARSADIFRHAAPRSVTVLIMEDPCCRGLTGIIQEAQARAGVTTPLETVVITRRGNRLPGIPT